MKATISQSSIEVTINLQITEAQARALDKFCYYAYQTPIINAIKEKYGADKPIKDLMSFLDTTHRELNPHLTKIDEARKIFDVVKK